MGVRNYGCSRRGDRRPKFGFSASRGLLHQGDRRPKSATPGDRRPKLLGKWKRKLLPILEIPGPHRTEALTEPSGNPGVLQREEDGRPKFGSRPLDASLRQGKGVRNSPPQGERRPKFLIVPKTPGGDGRPKLRGKWR